MTCAYCLVVHVQVFKKLTTGASAGSIMPGKVNPVIPEAVNQVSFEIIGNDLAVTLAAEAGQLQQCHGAAHCL